MTLIQFGKVMTFKAYEVTGVTLDGKELTLSIRYLPVLQKITFDSGAIAQDAYDIVVSKMAE